MNLPPLKPAVVGENQHGVYVADCEYACILIATLNVLKSSYLSPKWEAAIVGNFDSLLRSQPSLDFLLPHNIPQAIEELTGGSYRGKLVALGATTYLREAGVHNAHLYAIESKTFTLPAIFAVEAQFQGQPINHALALLRQTPEGIIVANNGEKTIRNILPRGTAYTIERVR